MNERTFSILISVALLVTLATPAHAYLDAGTGSYLVQVLIAGSLGALYTFKSFIFGFFRKKPKSQVQNPAPR